MSIYEEYCATEEEFIFEARKRFGEFRRAEGKEFLLLPTRDLDARVYPAFKAKNDLRFLVISWKTFRDKEVEERLMSYAKNTYGIFYLYRWSGGRGNVKIGDLELKTTHNRVMIITYSP